MAVSLKRALMEILTDWHCDAPSEWRDACGEVEFGSGNAALFACPIRRRRPESG